MAESEGRPGRRGRGWVPAGNEQFAPMGGAAQLASNSARAGSRTARSPDSAVRLPSKLSRTSRTGVWPRISPRSRASRWAQGRSARPAARTDSARLLPGAGPGDGAGRRPRASTPSTDTSPLMTALTRPGSRWLTREAIWLASVDFRSRRPRTDQPGQRRAGQIRGPAPPLGRPDRQRRGRAGLRPGPGSGPGLQARGLRARGCGYCGPRTAGPLPRDPGDRGVPAGPQARPVAPLSPGGRRVLPPSRPVREGPAPFPGSPEMSSDRRRMGFATPTAPLAGRHHAGLIVI